MAQCDYCGTMILFGGVRDNGLRFCGQECHEQAALHSVEVHVPAEILEQQVAEVHQGDCPKCGGPGPVDVHTSHLAWSALVVTSWRSTPHVCCRACGIRSQVNGLVLTLVVGWWGFPFGIILTPIQIVRNLAGMFSAPDPMTPSAQLENVVKAMLAASHGQASGQQPAEA